MLSQSEETTEDDDNDVQGPQSTLTPTTLIFLSAVSPTLQSMGTQESISSHFKDMKLERVVKCLF